MIHWKDSFRLGIDDIDAQHKHLFDTAEEIEALLALPDHIDKFDDIVNLLNELRDYTKYHFNAEQKLLLSIHYSNFFAHKVQHDDFITYIFGLDLDEIDHHQHEYVLNILKMLTDWLSQHVLVEDKAWAIVYKEAITN